VLDGKRKLGRMIQRGKRSDLRLKTEMRFTGFAYDDHPQWKG
jgi:hypothetical protein